MFRAFAAALTIAASLLASACASMPPTLDLSLRHASSGQKYVVELVPPASPLPVNRIHAWQVKLQTPAGEPVTHARIGVDGGMPQHGHGLPTKPRVTRETSPGTYVIDGMKFSMTGWWEIRLVIDAGGVTDGITFNTIVSEPVAAR